MIRYPWNLLVQAISDKGGVDINIHGLEGLSAREIFELPSVSLLQEIRLQLENPDLSDREKVEYIRSILES